MFGFSNPKGVLCYSKARVSDSLLPLCIPTQVLDLKHGSKSTFFPTENTGQSRQDLGNFRRHVKRLAFDISWLRMQFSPANNASKLKRKDTQAHSNLQV